MKKIFTVEQIREADAYTIRNEPIASADLMERAALACAKWIDEKHPVERAIKVLCGMGNNGGDGLAIARKLLEKGYNCSTFIVKSFSNSSLDFDINYQRLANMPGACVEVLDEQQELPDLAPDDLVIDAILGSGLTKPVTGFIAKIVNHINHSNPIVVSVDIPSGLFADSLPQSSTSAIIKADYTLTFEFPRLSFLFAESEYYVGEWVVLPIGINPEYIEITDAVHHLLESLDAKGLIKPRSHFAHKGHFGHSLLVAGSYGKMGAAVLASGACLTSGAGLLTTHVPKCGVGILQAGFPEAMASIDACNDHFSGIRDLTAYDALAIGPGIGLHEETASGLKLLIQQWSRPMIIDADGLNLLAQNKTWLPFLPPNSILTPHPKEFERFVGKTENSLERNKMQLEFSQKYGVYVILKGAYSCISTPQGKCYFNPTGNPGMATAGSGDVLTGILLGLMSQGLTPLGSCVLGTYLHGAAGDFAVSRKGMITASDITNAYGSAYMNLLEM